MNELRRVHIACDDVQRAAQVYSTIAGTGAVAGDRTTVIPVGSAEIVLARPKAEQLSGVVGVDITVGSVADRIGPLASVGIEAADFGDHSHFGLSGLDVSISEEAPADPVHATAHLDHVAVVIQDLGTGSAQWEAATGVDAHHMGLHPISNGAFSASRIVLGEAMMELISPTPGVASAVASRLAAIGEGPAAVAIPVDDVDACREALEAIGARVIRSDPHWMVHPKDAAGVLVQITPRVRH